MSFSRTVAVLVSFSLASAACGGVGFDPPEEIKTVRVLALHKSLPYAKPGETVDVKLLFWDGKATDGSRRDLQVLFLPCFNPLGDLYYNCFQSLGDAGPGPGPIGSDGGDDASDAGDADLADAALDAPSQEAGLPAWDADHTRTWSVRIPDAIISSRPQLPGVTPYGLVDVLFAVCAGQLALAPPQGSNGLPVVCKDGDRVLGPEDFVPGYASIYAYDERRNANPIIDDFRFEGQSIMDSGGAPDSDVRHVARCNAGSTCPRFELKMDVNRSSAEIDPSSTDPEGHVLQEQVWIAFYSSGGEFDHALRLVNDATRGWNDDNAVKWTAPAEPGPVRIWGVVHDNRGGTTWLEAKIVVD